MYNALNDLLFNTHMWLLLHIYLKFSVIIHIVRQLCVFQFLCIHMYLILVIYFNQILILTYDFDIYNFLKNISTWITESEYSPSTPEYSRVLATPQSAEQVPSSEFYNLVIFT